MTSPQAAKGARFEREIATILADELGVPVQRRRNLGTHADIGDLLLPDTCIEVKAFNDVARGLREGLADLEVEQAAMGASFGAVALWRPRKPWVMAMSVPGFCAMWREATS